MYYQIIKNDTLWLISDNVRFIKYNPNSWSYVEASVGEAEGIAIDSTPYNLLGHTMPGVTEEVNVLPLEDSGRFIWSTLNALRAQAAPIEINCGRITSLPITKYDSRITSTMVMSPNNYKIGDNTAITNLKIIVADGAITICGELNKETTLTVYLQED